MLITELNRGERNRDPENENEVARVETGEHGASVSHPTQIGTNVDSVCQEQRARCNSDQRAWKFMMKRAGQPNDASKRLVQRWESGVIAAPRPVYARALEAVTGMPIESLGFASALYARISGDDSDGHDVAPSAMGIPAATGPGPRTGAAGNYSGVWLSRYEYFSSGRDDAFVGQKAPEFKPQPTWINSAPLKLDQLRWFADFQPARAAANSRKFPAGWKKFSIWPAMLRPAAGQAGAGQRRCHSSFENWR